MLFRYMKAVFVMVLSAVVLFLTDGRAVYSETLDGRAGQSAPVVMGLEECLETAMKNNRRRPASRFAVEMAEARHRQALAAYWPQVSLRGGWQIMDDYPNYIFSPATIELPAGGTVPVTIPGVGTFPAGSITVPEQNLKMMDRESFRASVEASWLVYDGGMRKGYSKQGRGLVDMMKQASRRTDLEICDSTKRLYFGSVLAATLHQVGRDSLERMEATLDLTETMYREGSGRVRKTDWLDSKMMVESLRSMVAMLEKNELISQAALANTIGLSWSSSVRPADSRMPFVSFQGKLDDLVSTAYGFNPDWAAIEAGINAAEGAELTARSGYFPKIAVTGELHKWWNDFESGLATDQNKEGWTFGVGIEFPVFNGFMTKNKLAEARARLGKIRQEQFLLKEGIGLQIRDMFLAIGASEKSYRATLEAMNAAVENRELNTRAYIHELVETDKVIRAQIMEALMAAQHYRACYDHIALLSRLDLVVGTEILKRLEQDG